MPVDVQITENIAEVKCSGELNISQVAAFKESIEGLPPNVNDVRFDLEGLTDIDLAALQVFCSANRTFESNNRKMSVPGQKTDLLKKILNECGYDQDSACPEFSCKKCLWEEGGE